MCARRLDPAPLRWSPGERTRARNCDTSNQETSNQEEGKPMTAPASNDNRALQRLSLNGRGDTWAATLVRVLVRRALVAESALSQTEDPNSRQRAA